MLGTVKRFTYLGAVVSVDGSNPETPSRTAQATAALTKRTPIWRDNFWMKGEADALPCHFHISVGLRLMDLDCRVREKNAGF